MFPSVSQNIFVQEYNSCANNINLFSYRLRRIIVTILKYEISYSINYCQFIDKILNIKISNLYPIVYRFSNVKINLVYNTRYDILLKN